MEEHKIKSICRVLDFIVEYRDLIIHTNPYDSHLLFHLYETCVEDLHENFIWLSTCFALPPFLCDVLHLQAPRKGKRYDVVPVLKKNHYYYFSVFNHDFSIIYLDDSHIYLIDYYSETKRLLPFRVLKMSKNKLTTLLESLTNNDVDSYLKIHEGNDAFEKEFKKIFRRTARRHPEFAKLFDRVYEQELILW